jgi:hypothetical protein
MISMANSDRQTLIGERARSDIAPSLHSRVVICGILNEGIARGESMSVRTQFSAPLTSQREFRPRS